jgi:hypothetical protein
MNTLIVIYTDAYGICVESYTEEAFLIALKDEYYLKQINWKCEVKYFDADACWNGIIIKGGTIVLPEKAGQLFCQN